MNRWIVCLIGWVAWTTAAGQSLHFDRYSKPEGLPTTGVYDVAQDAQGALWIATEDGGLSRFDGRTFRSYRRTEGLPDASVRSLYVANNGRLWLGLPESGLAYFENDSIRTLALPLGYPDLHVRCMLEDAAGRLVIGTKSDGLFVLNDTVLEPMQRPPGLDATVRCALQDADGRSWYGTDHGVWCRDNFGWHYWGPEHGLSHPRVLSLLESDDGVWAGTETGLVRIRREQEHAEPAHAFDGIRIRTLARDLQNEIWVGTKTEGVAHFLPDLNANSPSWLSSEQGLPDNRFRKIFTDRDGTLWFGTRVGGLAALSDRRFQHYTQSQGFPEESMTAVAVQNDTTVWFGTLSGQVYRWQENALKCVYTNTSNDDDEITCIRPTSDGRVLIGTTNSGVLEWKSERISTLFPFSEMGTIRAIVARSDRLLIAGEELTRDVGFVWEDATRIDPLLVVNTAFFSANDDLWVGTPKGLYHSVWNAQADSYGALKGIPGTRNMPITAITQCRHGHLWVGTEGAGVLHVEDDRVVGNVGLDFMENYVVHFVAEDAQGDLWIGTPDGLQHLVMDSEGAAVLDAEFYDSDDGFAGVETRRNAVAVDREGTLWCGTTEGISRVLGAGYMPHYIPPAVTLDQVQLNYVSVAWDSLLAATETPDVVCLESDQNQFSFEVHAVSLTQPERLRYQYQLVGADQTWQPATTANQVSYSSLEPGMYQLLVRASVNGTAWSDQPAVAQFKIEPPFYATWPFRIGAALLIAVVVIGFVRLRLQYLLREKRKLEIKVDERTREVRAEQARSDRLLLNILPRETAEELKTHGATTARHYNDVSVLFTDFKGFTQLSEQLDSNLLVQTLDKYFRAFDALTGQFKVEKIKTIGDAYMCAAGIPTSQADHAVRMVDFAVALRKAVHTINAENCAEGKPAWDIRIGIHSGPVVAGVVGEKKFAYDIWGDTVNIAARMESSGEVDEINVSLETSRLISGTYRTEARGEVAAKNKGALEMYFVREKRSAEHESIHP